VARGQARRGASNTTAGRLIFKRNKCNTFYMKRSTKNVVRKRPGRPATGQDPVTAIRLSKEMRSAVDTWAAKQVDKPGRSEAIRRLVEMALAGKKKPPARYSEKVAAKARELASKAIDGLIDPSAPANEKAIRKRRLLKGPSVFRDVRIDRER
jgi:hypothetical protein